MKKVIFIFIISECLFSFVYGQIPTNGLVAHFPFSSNVSDASGNGRNGTIFGTVTQVPDRNGNAGQAISFNGSVAGINVNNWNTLTGNSPRTISIWFKMTNPTSNQQFLSWGTNSANQSNYLGVTIANNVKYLGFAGYSNDLFVANPERFFDNKWHSMIFTFDGSEMILLIDGVGLGSRTGVTLNTGSSTLALGFHYINVDYLNGTLDEVRVYNRALSYQEVQRLYLSELPTVTSSSQVIKLGSSTFIHTSKNGSTFVGLRSGAFTDENDRGSTFMGFESGVRNIGSENTFVGFKSGYYNSGGASNVFVGAMGGLSNRSGNGNVMVGVNAGRQNLIGSENVFIGNSTGNNNLSGSFNVFLGSGANSFGSNSGILQRSGAIGYNAKVSINDAIVLGDFENSNLKVGIGVHDPQHRLDVKGVINMRAAYNSPSLKINGKDFLGIDEDGEFWVSDFKLRYKNTNQWADNIFAKDYKLMPLDDLAKYVKENKHLPDIPSANEVVANGVYQNEITAKLLAKIEELTLYQIQQNKQIKQNMEDIKVLEAAVESLTKKQKKEE